MQATTGEAEDSVTNVFSAEELLAAQTLLRRMPVGEGVMESILALVRAFRPEEAGASERVRESVAWGPGPRASQAFMLTVRARALLQGRLAPDLSDVIAMAKPVLKHRMALNFASLARGESLDGLIEAEIAKSARLKDVA